MGSGVSVSDIDVLRSEVCQVVRTIEREKATSVLCHLLEAAHEQGADLHAIRNHLDNLLSRPTSWPWEWTKEAEAAMRNMSPIAGFSHTELCIYRNGTILHHQFESALQQLFKAFYRSSSADTHPLEIIEVTAIHNPTLSDSMLSSTLKIHEQTRLGGAYAPHWRKMKDIDLNAKETVLRTLAIDDPSACIIGFAGQADATLCRNICSNGFADLAKTDPGYFGRGVYLSTHSEYAALYACSSWQPPVDIKGSICDIPANQECSLIAAFATPGISYPITRDADYTKVFHWCDLKGQGMRFGCHSHAVLVNRLRVLRDMNYQSMMIDADPLAAYGELVFQHTAQVLPRYVIRCRRREDGAIPREQEPEIYSNLSADLCRLVELFEATNGLNWKVNTNWCQNPEIKTWQGPHYAVGCDAFNHVDRLRLPANNLAGYLPASLASLFNLRIVDSSENKLVGSIVAEFGVISTMEEFYVNNNQLSGNVAAAIILMKSRLGRTCRIGNQESDGLTITTDWSGTTMQLYASKCPQLEAVSKILLRECSIVGGVPLAMLQYLSSKTGNGHQIKEIDLSKNQISGLLPADHVFTLSRLDISYNQLTGKIPDLSNLTVLQDLILSNNNFTGVFPSFVFTLTTLRNLDISHNHFSGQISDAFARLPDLIRLEIGCNEFTGTLPESLSTLSKLILFSCEKNQLSGTLPEAYAMCTSLRALNVSHNNLSGELPPGIAAIPTLQKIELENNSFTGLLPDFGSAEENTKLRIINIQRNNFTGTIPKQWSRLTALETIFLRDNPLLNVSDVQSALSSRVEIDV